MGGRTLHYPFYAVDCQLSVGLVLLEGSLGENNFFLISTISYVTASSYVKELVAWDKFGETLQSQLSVNFNSI